MNIKDVEKMTGISSQNIRFYEKEGLITPQRNKVNGYREYGEEEVRRIKLIKMLRMLDMPIDRIAKVFDGTIPLTASLDEQQAFLENRMAEMRTAISFCDDLKKSEATLATLNVDDCLDQMEKDEQGFFSQWLTDYKDVVRFEHERSFTFIPDDAIMDRYDFANALYAYAMDHDLDLVITKESMYPEFTINGVEYTAERNYSRAGRIPTASITCRRVVDPKEEKEYLQGRKKWLRILHISWPGILIFVYCMLLAGVEGFKELFGSAEGWIILLAIIILCVAGVFRNYYLYWNMDGK